MMLCLIVIISMASVTYAVPQEKLVKKQVDTCGENYNINEGQEQTITSPRYPSNYEDYLVCHWTITTNPGNSLVVNVVDFHTQEIYDVLLINDGTNNIGAWSGDSGPPNFTSLSNEVSIIFETDSLVTEKGFKIIITVSGGSGSGDPHMITFDGRRYSFQGQCWYTFFKDCSAHPDFEVITKFAPRDDIKDKTRTVSFKVTVGDQYALVNGHDVVKGSKSNGHVYSSVIHVVKNNDVITLTFTSKVTTFTLEWTPRKHMLKASFSGTDYNGKLCGLLGNADGDTRNDLQTPKGIEVKDVTAFGESWKLNGEVCD